MKKRLIPFVCLAILLSLSLALPALAAPDNGFYRSHAEECVPSEEVFLAEAETTYLWESPQKRAVSGYMYAGESAEIFCTWTDQRGDTWGYAELSREGETAAGWVDLTAPGTQPTHALQSWQVLVPASLLAAAAIVVLFVPTKKKS